MGTDYDWTHAFDEALSGGASRCEGFDGSAAMDVADVATIHRWSEGENDGPPWLAVGELRDGRWFYLEASCDYTGWDCRASGRVIVGADEEQVKRMGCDNEARERLYGEEPESFLIQWIREEG